ncbi:MAG: flagellar hook-length control protein FliK, partial [Lachnospiraceae bacterium]|nr:flagellar hook-length control protein FliK [Lachnospiraceae bacterium]
VDAFDDEDSANEAYSEFIQTAADMVNDRELEQDNTIDLKSLQLVGKELTIAKKMANREDYEVPVYIDGNLTAVNLHIVHSEGESRVDIRMETERLGTVSASFSLREGNAQGTLISDNSATSEIWKKEEAEISDRFKNLGINLTNLNIVTESAIKKSPTLSVDEMDKEKDSVKSESSDLYKMAKSFIAVIRKL